ncbi:MAG: hypothetical protein BWX94_00417 [Tenericutes bacterium ADurb.Bin140]|nr:MAG: hypothetical protein BWX94_00417 [Tenericutes bacterium ADurb.Bin140]
MIQNGKYGIDVCFGNIFHEIDIAVGNRIDFIHYGFVGVESVVLEDCKYFADNGFKDFRFVEPVDCAFCELIIDIRIRQSQFNDLVAFAAK